MRKILVAAVLTAGLVAVATTALADPITTLPAGGTIVNGDKTFTFGSNACSITGGSGALTCAGITASAYVSTIPPDGVAGLLGITFQAAFNSGNPGTEDVMLRYSGAINSGPALFHDVQLTFNGNGLPGGMVATSVDEKVYIHGTSTLIGEADVSNPPAILTTDILLSQDVTAIDVVKDIELLSASGSIPATISLVNQTFSQTVPVPEPASLALFGTALLGLGWVNRRRRNRQ